MTVTLEVFFKIYLEFYCIICILEHNNWCSFHSFRELEEVSFQVALYSIFTVKDLQYIRNTFKALLIILGWTSKATVTII